MPKKEVKRESWGSSMGFMLAAIGSAVGLGNIDVYKRQQSHFINISIPLTCYQPCFGTFRSLL